MTTEAKVGAFTLSALLILAVSLVRLSNFTVGGERENTFNVYFSQVQGLKLSAPVQYAGVSVGQVTGIRPEGVKVIVTLKVDSKIAIPQDSSFSIVADGLLGERFVSIAPGRADSPPLKDGAELFGRDEASMDTVLAGMNALVVQMHDILSSINDFIGNQEMRDAMKETALNMRAMTAAMATTAQNSQEHIISLTKNLDQMTQRLALTANELDKMMTSVADGGKTAENLRQTAASIAAAAARVDNMAKAIEPTITDPQTAENLKATLKNARDISDRMNKFMSGGFPKVTPGMEAAYADRGEDQYQANFDLTIGGGDRYVFAGIEDIGHANRYNAQVGQKFGRFAVRGGLMLSHFGLGLDYNPDKNWRFTAEGYDANEATLRLGARYRIYKDTYFFTRVDDVTARRDHRTTYFGLRQEF